MVRLGKARRRGEEQTDRQTDLVAGFGFLNKHQARRDTLLVIAGVQKAGW